MSKRKLAARVQIPQKVSQYIWDIVFCSECGGDLAMGNSGVNPYCWCRYAINPPPSNCWWSGIYYLTWTISRLSLDSIPLSSFTVYMLQDVLHVTLVKDWQDKDRINGTRWAQQQYCSNCQRVRIIMVKGHVYLSFPSPHPWWQWSGIGCNRKMKILLKHINNVNSTSVFEDANHLSVGMTHNRYCLGIGFETCLLKNSVMVFTRLSFKNYTLVLSRTKHEILSPFLL